MNLSSKLLQLELKRKIYRAKLAYDVSLLLEKYDKDNEVTFKIDAHYVHLSGSLPDFGAKQILHEEIDSMMGVRGIKNEIKIKSR